MSLKARIEAVIYAAEEPVTLPQLTALFREEALASRAARLAPPAVDPEAPSEADVAASPGGTDEVIAELLAAEPASDDTSVSEEGAEGETAAAGEAAEDGSAVPSELAAQNSADAAVAVPDFAGEPQPFPNQPPEATTPDAPIPLQEGGEPWAEPATQAVEVLEEPAEDAGMEEAPGSDGAAGGVPPALTPEEEKRLARQREREAREEIRRIVDELIAEYTAADRGVEIREIAGGFRVATRAEYHDAVRTFVRSLKPPMKLSLQALETLAVIAYKQPITAPEIADVRGVDSGGVLGSLVARKLITTAGRKPVIGRPILYKTTKEFLLRFGLKDLGELPSLEEFEKMASELADQEEPAAEQMALTEKDEAADEAELEEAAEGAGAVPEENPEPALAGAESEPELMPAVEEQAGEGPGEGDPAAAAGDEAIAADGPGDGDPPPPGDAAEGAAEKEE